MPPGPADLQTLAQEYLDACIAALDTIPILAPGLGGSPERVYLSPGLPAFDCCDQLTVHVSGVSELTDNPGLSYRVGRRNIVGLVATSTRCLPTISDEGDIPSPTELSDAAEQLNADGWALWNHIYNLIRAEELFTICEEVFWDGLRSVTPSGGCGGWTLNLRVNLGGYQETL